MKNLLLLLFLYIALAQPAVKAQPQPDYSQYPVYNGSDLGLTFEGDRARLRVWAPTAQGVTLRVYAQGEGGEPLEKVSMEKAENGTWTYSFQPGTKGFYSVQAVIDGKAMNEVADPYAHAVGINGKRGAILDPGKAAPENWAADKRVAPKQPTDIIIGEMHVRDISMSPNSGIKSKGKYLGLAESGTKGPNGVSTGLDHLAELGVTHVHLLPTNDFASLDENLANRLPQYNWGYDPLNYSVPEGTYATDPARPESRIREFKQMVQALHNKGLGVVLDVVYNHTADAGKSAFEQLVPGYYYRHRPDGRFSDASACGNEVASERPMVRKLIVESVLHWAREYHVDGFRFDLMGVLDLETMRQVRAELDQVDPKIYVYGEGWTAGGSPLPDSERALKANMAKAPGVAAFGDELRDGVRGHFANAEDPGFGSGKPNTEESVKFGIVAATRHPQVDYQKVNYSKAPWAAEPSQSINYVACHDDMVLWDKLRKSNPGATDTELMRRDMLCNAIVFTSQGVPFLPIGDEFLRTKKGSHNSYNQPDSVNQIDWALKAKNRRIFEFYKGLIALRKAHPAFRLPTRELIEKHLEFLPNLPAGVVAYRLKDNAGGDAWRNIVVVFNGNKTAAKVPVPAGKYKVILKESQVREAGLGMQDVTEAPIELAPSSALILAQ